MKKISHKTRKIVVSSEDLAPTLTKLKRRNKITNIFEALIITGSFGRREYTIIYQPKWWVLKDKE